MKGKKGKRPMPPPNKKMLAPIASYVVRFSGFARGGLPSKPPTNAYSANPYQLLGLAKISLDKNGILSGHQDTTLMPISSTDQIIKEELKFTHARYDLTGGIQFNGDNTGIASINFKLSSAASGDPAADMIGEFSIVYTGKPPAPEAIWIISSATYVVDPKTGNAEPVDEAVSGEATKLKEDPAGP